MNESSPVTASEVDEVRSPPQPPPRPGFGFLLGGTTLGIFFGCVLLCAGASPPHVIIIVLSICGAITGGLLESLWPKPVPVSKRQSATARQSGQSGNLQSPFGDQGTNASRPTIKHGKSHAQHECQSCGEVFDPSPVICPMCGHTDKNRRTR